MERPEEWLANANDALSINLVRPNNDRIWPEPCHPQFTYPIFGDEEVIFGYRDLSIALNFQAHNLRPSLAVRFGKKWKPVGDVRATDIESTLRPFLPDYALSAQLKEDSGGRSKIHAGMWKPPGVLVQTYTIESKTFEVWCASLADADAKGILRAMQILVPLFIEGGTCQTLDDQDWTMERWKLFLLYQASPLDEPPEDCPYVFVGFSTSYRLWVCPGKESAIKATEELCDAAPTTAQDPSMTTSDRRESSGADFLASNSRERISQFLILPPFQGKSHGTHLYEAMMQKFLSAPYCFEVTVEDPNEAFDDLRDWCDLKRLRSQEAFTSIALAERIPPEALRPSAPFPKHLLLPLEVVDHVRQENKIAPRQFWRLVEMQLLSQIPTLHRNTARITRKAASADNHDRSYYFWRLLVKERLFRHNLDQLSQLDHGERIEKLEETLKGVQQDYERLLDRAESRLDDIQPRQSNVEAAGSKRRKRVVDEDEDDDTDEDKDAVTGGRVDVDMTKRKKTT